MAVKYISLKAHLKGINKLLRSKNLDVDASLEDLDETVHLLVRTTHCAGYVEGAADFDSRLQHQKEKKR